MRESWMAAMLLVSLFALCMGTEGVNGREVTLEDDTYYVSVNPEDPDQGLLTIPGEVDPGDLGLRDTMTVSLSVVVHELRDGVATGRTWYAEVSYDDSTIGGSSNVFTIGDDPEPFTITTDSAGYDPAVHDSIPIPTGLSDNVEGRVVLTATFTAAGGQNSDEVVQATIYPELYHLINLSTPDDPVLMKAGYSLIYSLTLKNAGNMVENINLEVPVLEQLDELGFTTNLQYDRFTDVEPGESLTSNLSIKAPLEIKRNDSYDLVITAYTDSEDPDTLEPASKRQIFIDLILERSKINQPQPGDDDDPGNDDDDEPFTPTPGQDPMATDDEAEPWMVVVAIGFIVVIVLIIALLIFRRGGGENDQDEEIDQAHSSMVRI